MLSGSTAKDAGAYWRKLKQRLKTEGSEVVTKCHGLKMLAEDGKLRETDVLDTQGILRLVQSIPSPNSEPFKLWLAQVGNDRLNEIAAPEKALLRGADFYRANGYTEGWINQRLQTIEMRQELTDEWRERGLATEKEYAILTNEITKAWRGMTVGAYKLRIGSRKSHLRKYTTVRVLIKQILKPIRNEYNKLLRYRPVLPKSEKQTRKPSGIKLPFPCEAGKGKIGRRIFTPLSVGGNSPVATPLWKEWSSGSQIYQSLHRFRVQETFRRRGEQGFVD
ncbi:phage antirepressor [Planctomycetales bacterium]|nr:phage antirepressor [Planctomycetales bacterium]GHT02937.1 phage antirepressor [Planctomycetales bacterium]